MWRAQLNAERLAVQLEALARKQREGKHPHALLGGEMTFGSLGERAPDFARELATTLARGEYRFGPVVPTRALIEGKWRVLYRSNAIDMVVTSALANELSARLESTWSEHLYSYRAGRSAWQAIGAFVEFVARHRGVHHDPRTRGLYVIRRDVRSYGDSIPVDDDSALWRQIESATQPDPFTSTLLRQAMVPRLGNSDAYVTSVPTGSSLQPLMCNLYLTPVDAIGTAVVDGFYARAGDDLLFAHPDPQVAQATGRDIDHAITELRLTLSEHKSVDLYFTGSGTQSRQWPGSRATTHLQYLGASVDFRGNVGLKTDRARTLLHRLRRRVDNTLRLCAGDSVQQRVESCCKVVRGALDPNNPQCEPSVPLILGATNDRRQLRQLDYWIALHVAQRVTGIVGPRAFRKLSYVALRDQGLPSLVAARHRRGRT